MRKIKIKDIGRFSEEQFNKVIRFAVIELDARLKEGSPVDLEVTGRFHKTVNLLQMFLVRFKMLKVYLDLHCHLSEQTIEMKKQAIPIP